MAINPAVLQFFTRDFWRNPAVVSVDINRANPNDNLTSAKALGIVILGTVDGNNTLQPLVTGSGGGSGTLPANPVNGQQGVTASAQPLASNALTNGVVLKAPSTNAQTVYVGKAGVTQATGYPLAPGEAISFAVANTSGLYIIGTAGDNIAYAGS